VRRETVPVSRTVKIPDDQKNLLTGSSSSWEKPEGVCIPKETIKSTCQVPIATGSWRRNRRVQKLQELWKSRQGKNQFLHQLLSAHPYFVIT
jgi:hypothetical protein